MTHDILHVDEEEIEKRHAAIEFYLVKDLEMDKDTIGKIRNHEQPYRIVIRAVKEKVWDIDEILEGISAIYQAQKVPKAPDPSLINNDEE